MCAYLPTYLGNKYVGTKSLVTRATEFLPPLRTLYPGTNHQADFNLLLLPSMPCNQARGIWGATFYKTGCSPLIRSNCLVSAVHFANIKARMHANIANVEELRSKDGIVVVVYSDILLSTVEYTCA